jgi:anti-sigma B factor antagonist
VTFEHTVIGDVHVLTPKKNLMGQEETLALRGAFEEVAARGAPKVVVDLGKIDWMNSMGIGALVGMMTSCKNRGGSFSVVRIGRRIRSSLVVTKIALIMDTFETLEEGLAAAQKKPAK